jgi:enamine deaminase RidA (YjgF/YER057c/UK114 family)
MPVIKLNPSSMPDAGAMGYSQITTSEPGTLVYISGQVAWSADNQPVPSDLRTQTERAIDNVRNALTELDASPDDVTSVRIYVVHMDPEKLAAVAEPLASFFGGQAPCVTGIGVTSLAAPELLIEIEVTAVINR